MQNKQMLQYVKELVAPVDIELQAIQNNSSAMLEALFDKTIGNPGKKIRPALLFMCFNMLQNNNNGYQNAVNFATTIEMVHLASLAHDDVIDNSPIRRNMSTINKTFNNKTAILFGDFMVSEAINHVIKTQNLSAIQTVTMAAKNLALGEILQMQNIGNLSMAIADYLYIIELKTASLFIASCKLGAMAANANVDNTKIIESIGLNLGIIFQIIDDILDYFGDNTEIGKNTMEDFFEQKATLPLILTFQEASQIEVDFIKNTCINNIINNKDEVLAIMRKCNIRRKCLDFANQYAIKVKQSLSNFTAKDAERLTNVVDYFLERIR
jgi:octaprenyl-diphosphate synthase